MENNDKINIRDQPFIFGFPKIDEKLYKKTLKTSHKH